MENLSSRITYLRKKINITQTELGNRLNISPQAVSKWENGLSEPDIETMKKLCEIFGVTMDELVGNVDIQEKNANNQSIQEATADKKNSEVESSQISNIPLGKCYFCEKPIYDSVFYTETFLSEQNRKLSVPICKACLDKQSLKKARLECQEKEHERSIGIGWGIFAGILLAIIVFFIALFNTNLLVTIILTIVSLIMGFTLVSQIIWGNFIAEMFAWFLKSLKLPGLIFTLDLDGIFWFITVKLLFGIIGFMFSTCFFVLGILITGPISIISFPFSLIKVNNEIIIYQDKVNKIRKKIKDEEEKQNA